MSCLLFGSSPRLPATWRCKVYKRYTISICSNDIRCFQGLANGYTMYECLFVYLSRLRTFCLTSPFFLRTAPYKHHMHKTIESQGKEWGSRSGWFRLEIRRRIRVLAVPSVLRWVHISAVSEKATKSPTLSHLSAYTAIDERYAGVVGMKRLCRGRVTPLLR
jgi:hypothetical protein